MRSQNILRVILFVVFFCVGASTLSVSILCEDLLAYYNNKRLLRQEEESFRQLESLSADYDVVLEQLEGDPNVIKRIAPAALGTEPEGEETVYPKVRAEQLAAAREALEEDLGEVADEGAVPIWVKRCCRPIRRIILFVAGGFLVLVSFICFGPISDKG